MAATLAQITALLNSEADKKRPFIEEAVKRASAPECPKKVWQKVADALAKYVAVYGLNAEHEAVEILASEMLPSEWRAART